MSKPRAKNPTLGFIEGEATSWGRVAAAVGLIALGIAWIAVYTNSAMDAANWVKGLGKQPHTAFPWMADLHHWNYLIGFGLIFLGMIVAANPSTPMGRGRGVVIGMVGSFVIGLIWIVVYYFLAGSANPHHIPLLTDLGSKNLFVGIGFMAVGFAYAMKWE